MTKLNSFQKQFIAIVKGDDAEALSAKVWRQSESALKVQIASLSGDLIRKEDSVETANDNLVKTRANFGRSIEDRDQYVVNLINAKEACIKAQKELDAHKATIAFLEEEYANLKAE
jgi:hypothetical protein